MVIRLVAANIFPSRFFEIDFVFKNLSSHVLGVANCDNLAPKDTSPRTKDEILLRSIMPFLEPTQPHPTLLYFLLCWLPSRITLNLDQILAVGFAISAVTFR